MGPPASSFQREVPPRPSISNKCLFKCTPNVKGLTCLPSYTEMPAIGEMPAFAVCVGDAHESGAGEGRSAPLVRFHVRSPPLRKEVWLLTHTDPRATRGFASVCVCSVPHPTAARRTSADVRPVARRAGRGRRHRPGPQGTATEGCENAGGLRGQEQQSRQASWRRQLWSQAFGEEGEGAEPPRLHPQRVGEACPSALRRPGVGRP